MVTSKQIDDLEQAANEYFMASQRVSFEIDDRQEELTGILRAYQGMNTASAQVLRHWFLEGGAEK